MTQNAVTKVGNSSIAHELKVRNINGQTWKVLQETLFPGASDASILMAVDYCKVRNLDILKKPVHIVPIWDKNQKRMVDTVWQGISELRTTAMRTGQYAGCDETVFGPDITKNVGGVEITFPEYAQITVYRIVAGQRVAFNGGKVRWLETVATTKEGAPNSMWKQRPYGQLEKCAEAAALRKAFPEELGNEYAAEEMGNKIDNSLKKEKKEEDIIDVFAEPVVETTVAEPKAQEPEVSAEMEAMANEYFEADEQ